jgi:hypothetical protein
VFPKKTFDDWARSSQISRLDIRKLHSPDAQVMPQEIDVSPTTKITDVIRLIVGEEPITDLNRQCSTSEPHYALISPFPVRQLICWELYCLQASRTRLEHAKPLNGYDIQDGDFLLFESQISSYSDLAYSVRYVRDVPDFCKLVLEAGDIARSLKYDGRLPVNSFRSLNLNGVLLYTDADFELSKYLRYNFSELEKIIGDSLNLYFIVQPTLLHGRSAREYWKGLLEESAYSILHCLGFTKNKPYSKSDAYEIASMLGVLPECLPCLVIFNDLKSSEKIVITLIDNYTLFFRKLSSVLKKI